MKNLNISMAIIMFMINNTTLAMEHYDFISTQTFNQCLAPKNDHAEYITEQPGWPSNTSPFNAKLDGKNFKKT